MFEVLLFLGLIPVLVWGLYQRITSSWTFSKIAWTVFILSAYPAFLWVLFFLFEDLPRPRLELTEAYSFLPKSGQGPVDGTTVLAAGIAAVMSGSFLVGKYFLTVSPKQGQNKKSRLGLGRRKANDGRHSR
jgi:hypothetical protein